MATCIASEALSPCAQFSKVCLKPPSDLLNIKFLYVERYSGQNLHNISMLFKLLLLRKIYPFFYILLNPENISKLQNVSIAQS